MAASDHKTETETVISRPMEPSALTYGPMGPSALASSGPIQPVSMIIESLNTIIDRLCNGNVPIAQACTIPHVPNSAYSIRNDGNDQGYYVSDYRHVRFTNNIDAKIAHHLIKGQNPITSIWQNYGNVGQIIKEVIDDKVRCRPTRSHIVGARIALPEIKLVVKPTFEMACNWIRQISLYLSQNGVAHKFNTTLPSSHDECNEDTISKPDIIDNADGTYSIKGYMFIRFKSFVDCSIIHYILCGINPMLFWSTPYYDIAFDEHKILELFLELNANMEESCELIKIDKYYEPDNETEALKLITDHLKYLVIKGIPIAPPCSKKKLVTKAQKDSTICSKDGYYIEGYPDVVFPSKINRLIAICLMNGVNPFERIWQDTPYTVDVSKVKALVPKSYMPLNVVRTITI